MKLYIKSTACVSPLEITETDKSFEFSMPELTAAGNLHVVNPNYKELLSLNSIRRISKFNKIGVFAALKCVQNFTNPIDGIIVGTGIGGFQNTEKFILDMDDSLEKNLSPNPFFQSLHSSLSGNIAIATKCDAYNTTYVNKGTSFESALLDSMMMIQEDPIRNILIGTADEITDDYTKIANKVNYFQKEELPTLGEGAAFVLLSGTKTDHEACILGMKTLFMASKAEINEHIQHLLKENKIAVNAIDIVLSGDETLTTNLTEIDTAFAEIPSIH
ncbi:beta-ketoacyl synthase chain length factor, partial [Flavobacteriaceae bacterium]|nr:beta-ketoacyl synthase chain length factor [Flavobacteriaceae bacterium]